MASVLGRPSYHFSSKVILRALAALTAVSVFVNLLRSYTFTSSVTTKEATTATVNYANAKATAQSPWCPSNAICNNSPLCQPCKQRFLFIISTGRAASTTLMAMINHLPNVRISGENHGILYEASRLETKLHVQAMACTIQRVLSTLNPPPREILDQLVNNHFGVNEGGRTVEEYDNSQIIGAKMIRIQTRFPTSDEAVDFFNYNFPCAKFIVNTRSNIDEQLQSQKKYFKPADQFDLEKQNQFLYSFAAGLGMDKARLIFTEEWTQNVTALNEVLEWVGFQHCQFRNILHHNHNGYHPDKKTAIKLGCTDER